MIGSTIPVYTFEIDLKLTYGIWLLHNQIMIQTLYCKVSFVILALGLWFFLRWVIDKEVNCEYCSTGFVMWLQESGYGLGGLLIYLLCPLHLRYSSAALS